MIHGTGNPEIGQLGDALEIEQLPGIAGTFPREPNTGVKAKQDGGI